VPSTALPEPSEEKELTNKRKLMQGALFSLLIWNFSKAKKYFWKNDKRCI